MIQYTKPIKIFSLIALLGSNFSLLAAGEILVQAGMPAAVGNKSNPSPNSSLAISKNSPKKKSSPAHMVKKTIAPVNMFDAMIGNTQKDMEQISALLSGLSAMIADGSVPTVVNKKEVLQNLRTTLMLIHSIMYEKFVQSDPTTIYFLILFNQSLIDHLLKAARNGFRSYQPFDPSGVVARSFTKNVPQPAKLTAIANSNKKQLIILTDAIEKAGLRWYNTVYRGFDRYVIQPCEKYSIPSRVTFVGAAGLFGLYFWWRMGNKSFKKHMPFFSEHVFGPRPKVGPMGTITNEKDLKAIGKAEINLSEFSRGLLPIGAYLYGRTYDSLKSEWGDGRRGLHAWLKNQFSIVSNYLKGGAYIKEAQKAAKEVDHVSFDDLVGLDHVKQDFKLLVNYLENPEPYDRLGITPSKGILLIGDSRTGKSYSVKALFGEVRRMQKSNNRLNNFKFIEFSASEINQNGIGYLLSLVRRCAPCIVFIDEIDLLDLQRKGKNELLSELLIYMSGTLDSKDPKNQVIIIGATNMPENLDSALRQPGRFGQEHRFEYPSFAHRSEYITRKLNKLSLPLERFDIAKLALDTEGKSYEALNILINNALLKARIHGQMLTQEHLESTLESQLRHVVECEDRDIPQAQQELLAAHFAGHALALHLLNSATKLSSVTIKQVMTTIKEELMGMHLYQPKQEDDKQKRFEYGAVFTNSTPDKITSIRTQEETLLLCKFHLAGIAAEKILLGSCGYSCHTDDKSRALALAQAIAFEGLPADNLPKAIKADRTATALRIIEQCEAEVTKLLAQNKATLQAIAQALQEKKTLSTAEVNHIIAYTATVKAATAAAA